MTLNRVTEIPLYQQIKNYLDDLISSRRFGPGQLLPSEKEFQIQFGVSRITVRQALNVLSLEGKVVRVPGKGTFVSRSKAESLTALASFSENMRALGLEPSYRHTKVELIDPPTRVRATLKLEDNEKAIHLHRLMFADDLPMAIQEAYLPGKVFDGQSETLIAERLDKASLYDLLERDLKIPLVGGDEYVEPSVASPSESEQLGIKRRDLVLVITRLTLTKDEQPIEFVKLIFRADRYRYHVKLYRSR